MAELSVLIPTYNEAENVGPLLKALVSVLKDQDAEIIVIDDNSPDGTAQVALEYADKFPNIRVVVREGKLGLGSAVLEGLKASSGKYILMMDADLSHSPQDVPRFVEAARDAEIVLGSRYIPGGKIAGWPFFRTLASRVAIFISRIMLGLLVKDPTTGFALFRRDVLEGLNGKLSARGFKLALEVVAKSPHARVAEVPITFANRQRGASKFNVKEVWEFLRLCYRLRRERTSR